MSHYDAVLDKYRNKAILLANETINELYSILREEEKLEPQDARAKIEQDCVDLWSKATIMKFLPPETKNEKKRKAGKIRAELDKEKNKKQMLISAASDGQNCVGFNPAENDFISREEQESRTFHKDLGSSLSSRSLSPELLESANMLAEKDKEIEELKALIAQYQNYQTNQNQSYNLYMSDKIARIIFGIMRDNLSRDPSSVIGFDLQHDGYEVIQVQCLDGKTNSNNAGSIINLEYLDNSENP